MDDQNDKSAGDVILENSGCLTGCGIVMLIAGLVGFAVLFLLMFS